MDNITVNILKRFKRWFGAIAAILLTTVLWLQGLPVRSAQASPHFGMSGSYYYPHALTQLVKAEETRGDRLEAINDCLPSQLNDSSTANKDDADRLSSAIDRVGTDHPDTQFDLMTDDPELAKAGLQFQKCLDEKGMPTRLDLQAS